MESKQNRAGQRAVKTVANLRLLECMRVKAFGFGEIATLERYFCTFRT
jgi:hypothetical protein